MLLADDRNKVHGLYYFLLSRIREEGVSFDNKKNTIKLLNITITFNIKK